ncbi:MAG: PIN domain-containing protein [Thermodesulfobacteriota bacterium]|nr:PIN domain-containing protein [Thermodesulfobacteriota bacterium]
MASFFRYSDDTANSLLSIMYKIKDRIWLPYQAVYEYHKNLYSVIEKEAKSYSETIKKVDELKEKYTPKKDKEVISSFENLKQVLEGKRGKITSLLSINPIKEKLAELLNGKIGEPFNQDKLSEIYEEGKNRYEQNIPPGYFDVKDKKGDEKYGDLVLWKQVLEKAKQVDTAIILVTGDVKEDWFIGKLGKTICPRPELVAEFRKVKDIHFYIYPTRSFIKFANDYFVADVKEEVLTEVKDFEDMTRKAHEVQFLEDPWDVFDHIVNIAASVGAEIIDYQDDPVGGALSVKRGTIGKSKIEMLMNLAKRKGCFLKIIEIDDDALI